MNALFLFSSLVFRLIFLLILTGLSACGGGGSSNDEEPFAATASDYWLSGTGARWIYQRIDGRIGFDPTPVIKTVTDTGEITVNGVRSRKFEHSWSLFENTTETEYRFFDGISIQNYADLASEFGFNMPAITYAEVPAPLIDGETVTIYDDTEFIDIDGDGVTDNLRILVETSVGLSASLSVPAGDFTDLLRLNTVITGTYTDGATGLSARASAKLTAWYARGVGIVKRVFEDPEYLSPYNIITEELVGLDAAGQRAGLLPGLTLLDDIGSGTDSSTPSSIEIVVGNNRVLTLAIREGTVEAAIHALDGNLIWRGVALRAPTGNVFGSLSASYDGVNFRIVATHYKPFDSPSITTVATQRIAIDGSLRDGSTGTVLETGIADNTESIWSIQSAAIQGRLLVTWGRYDTSYVPVAEGLVRQRGYVLEGRLFDAQNSPLASLFELTEALPAAVEIRDDQFIVLPKPQVDNPMTLQAWGISVTDGNPASTEGTIIDERLLVRTGTELHQVENELWLSFSSFEGMGLTESTLTIARLGRDGVLLDGLPSAPGRQLLITDKQRGLGSLGLTGTTNILAWTEEWDTLLATTFASDVLTGITPLPNNYTPLTVGDPINPIGSASRSLLWTGPAGSGLMVAWLENEQSANTPSDRVKATFLLPPLSSP